jgi:DNA polymerase-3 subunit alpha
LTDIEGMEKMEEGCMTRVGGLVSQFQKRFTKKTQEPMGTFRLERLDGSLEVVAFPEPYREFGVHLHDDHPVMVCGELSHGEGLRMKASEIYPLTEVARHFTERVSLHIPAASLTDEKFQELRGILRRHPGEVEVIICLQFPGGEKVFIDTDRTFTVTASPKLIHELEHVLGEDSIYVGVVRRACKRNNGSHNGWKGRRNGARREAAPVNP